MKTGHSFSNQVVLVTGAAAGIGRATALAFAREGARVVVSDVQEKGGIEAVELLRGEGHDARFIGCDVSQESQVKALIRSTVDAFGRLDIAFNNAGIEGVPAPLHESQTQNWEKTLNVNLSSVYWCLREELQIMLKQRRGAIVNCASIAGLRGFANMGAYTASKHGVVGLTKSAALDYASQGIRINAICPGVIHTPMIDRFTHGDPKAASDLASGAPMARMGQPEEIAHAVLWLCSPQSGFVTGTELVVDGGWCAK